MSVFGNIIPDQVVIDERHEQKALVSRILFNAGRYNLSADMILPHTAPLNAAPLCSSVYNGQQRIWNFQEEKFVGRAHLLYVNETPIVALVGKDSGAVEKVVALPVLAEESSLGIKVRIELKIAAAAELVVEYALDTSERKVHARLTLERAEAAKRQLIERQAAQATEREERQQRRAERRQAVLARQDLAVVNTAGKPLYGKPVVSDEWQSLPDGTWVVLVESYDSQTGHCSGLTSHFVVSKKGGHCRQSAVTTDITFRTRQKVEAPKPLGVVLLEMEDDVHEVLLYDPVGVKALKERRIEGLWAVRTDQGLVAGRNQLVDDRLKIIKIKAKEFA